MARLPVDFLQRLVCVDDQVDDDLLQLVRIDEHVRHRALIVAIDRDAAASQPIGEQLERAVEQRRHRHGALLRLVLPGDRHEGSHDARAPLRRRLDLLGPRAGGLQEGVAGKLLLQHRRLAEHHRQRIVQLMRDAGEQRADRGEFLALVQRLALALDFRGRRLRRRKVAQIGGEIAPVGKRSLR